MVAGVIVGTAIGWAISGMNVSASDAFQVKATGVEPTPYQSDRLALTYARLLPEEVGVQHLVGVETHHTDSYVKEHLTMSAQEATPVVFARFSASSSESALAGLHGLAQALRSVTDTAGSGLRVTVLPLSEPTLNSGFSRSKALLLASVGGFLIGLALMLTLERRDPRVDSLNDLANLLTLPVSDVTRDSLCSTVASLRRNQPQETVEILVAGHGRAGRAVTRLVKELDLPFVPSLYAKATNDAPHILNRVLVVKRGTSAACVREICLYTEYPITAALLLTPRSSWPRTIGFRHGLHAA